ncbi:hypothetical protein GQ457_07G027500 [Hibiscus cannabinus]
MISSKKLVALARKWKTMAGIGRRTISIPSPSNNRKLVAKAGHFVVYSLDEARFVVPLAYLGTNVFKELFRLSEEEFGLPRDGPITLPCDAAVLEYVISLVQRHDSEMLEKALFVLLGSHQCYTTTASQELC